MQKNMYHMNFTISHLQKMKKHYGNGNMSSIYSGKKLYLGSLIEKWEKKAHTCMYDLII